VRRLPLLLALVPAFALAASGCGDSKPHLFAPAKTRECLVEKGARIGGRLDFIASTATGGAFKARIEKNAVTVVFGQTEEDAHQIALAYTRAAGRNIGIGDILARRLNVVLLWDAHPSDEQLGIVADCLK
jgi:hypothetical protein